MGVLRQFSFRSFTIFFLGLLTIQIGVALFIQTNTGSDPYTVFIQGVARAFNLSIGIANILTMATLFITIFLLARKELQIGTLLAVVLAGPSLDFILKVIPSFNEVFFIGKISLIIISCLIIAIGFSILLAARIGVGPNDLLPLIIRDKTNIQYRWIRISMDCIFLLFGFLLGGTVGLGTVAGAMLIGPFIQYFIPVIDNQINPA